MYEVEALLLRQKGKVAGLVRLGFYDEADSEGQYLEKIEELPRLCIEHRDRISHRQQPDLHLSKLYLFLIEEPLRHSQLLSAMPPTIPVAASGQLD